MSKLSCLAAMAIVCLMTACSPVITHNTLAPTARKASGEIAVASKAENMDSLAGFGSISPFCIPVCPVFLQGDYEKDMMVQIKDGFEHAGYTVKIVNSPAEAGTQPVLSCHVNKIKFWNCSWLFPFVWNWGRFDVKLTLTAPGAKVLWEQSYLAKAKGFYDFAPTVKTALTRLLDQMVQDLGEKPPVLTATMEAPKAAAGI